MVDKCRKQKWSNWSASTVVQATHDVRINVTIWQYRDVRNWLFTCLEVGKMETNYPAI